jgi:hypothetical protein
MKMGTNASPWRYDPTACRALQLVGLRRRVILSYVPQFLVFPISRGSPLTLPPSPVGEDTRIWQPNVGR